MACGKVGAVAHRYHISEPPGWQHQPAIQPREPYKRGRHWPIHHGPSLDRIPAGGPSFWIAVLTTSEAIPQLEGLKVSR